MIRGKVAEDKSNVGLKSGSTNEIVIRLYMYRYMYVAFIYILSALL